MLNMLIKSPITPEGQYNLLKELNWREIIEKSRILKILKYSRLFGDLSENSEFHSAKEERSLNENKILELRENMLNSEVTRLKGRKGRVYFNTKIILMNIITKEKKYIHIVGNTEISYMQTQNFEKISISSSTARKIINKKIGDIISIQLNKNEELYEIINIIECINS